MSDFGSKLNKAFLSPEEYAAISAQGSNSTDTAEGEFMEYSESSQLNQLPPEGILVIRGFVVYHFSPGFVIHHGGPSIPASWMRLPDCRRDRSYFETVFIPSRREIVAIRFITFL